MTATIASTVSYRSTGNAEEHAVNIPSASAGDLLLVVATSDQDSTQTTPGGWTRFTNTASSTLARHCIYARVSTATEASNISIGLSATQGLCSLAAQITNWYGGLDGMTFGTAVANLGDNPDPPSSTASWGEGDNLFVVTMGNDNEDPAGGTVSAYPDLFTGNQSITSAIQAGGTTTAWASYATSVATMDPSVFTLAGSARYITQTLVIRPSAAVAFLPGRLKVHSESLLVCGKVG